MTTLRLTQTATGPDTYHVQVSLEGDGLPRQTASARFAFALSAQDQERLRWYLEDFLQFPFDPAPETAARVEERMVEIGTQLFRAVFHADDDARDLWATLRTRLNDTRVEIVTGVQEATAIPWELIRDPKTDAPLALRARAFVRAQPQAVQRPLLPRTESGPIRILLVICRPRQDNDVPFRSIAIRIIKGLGADARAAFDLDVLRPPTFERLAEALRDAKARGVPYHVVHFDGHGIYTEVEQKPGGLADILKGLSVLLLSGPRSGPHGYLLFENPALDENMQLVDGTALGQLLVETDVPVLVLNACRSAHAEGRRQVVNLPYDDVHSQVRALGSLAQEVMDAGLAGVVAMHYNVYVVTAAQFVADLYASLTQGHTLGEAVTLGRKQLHAQPLRTIAYDPRPLQDWPVPVVYEAAPISLFPPPAEVTRLDIRLGAGDSATLTRGALDPGLPPRPDVGFFGRDGTLLALDRGFDTQSILLLHAYAGSGKTSAAAEFARWYALTGGIEGDGPVLFTSFTQHKPLARVLDQVGQRFRGALETAGINWLALDDAERRSVALQVMQQIPVLWIWDNVEPVAGFPVGTDSAWSAAEQQELADFLRAARETRAKFLLTSRRDERGWLGDLPQRIAIPPMRERVQLARALVAKYGRRLSDVEDWRPLLDFTRGNPLTITVLVGQALRDGLATREQIEGFVAQLCAGEAVEDDESEGRDRSLGASLSYGFRYGFDEGERGRLALLYFFQGCVDVTALRVMGDPEMDWCLPEVRGLTREDGIALLDRAAEVGLLTAHGGGYYSIHPALPWYFKTMFDQHYPQTTERDAQFTTRNSAARAFVEAMGVLGDYYHNQYGAGNRDVIGSLIAEEANLLYARRLARKNGWWWCVMGAMQGLDQLYDHTGRRAEWARLVEDSVSDFVDPVSDGPLPRREEQWSLVTEYRVRLAEKARQWAEAERLQQVCVEWDRQRAASALAAPPEMLNDAQRNDIRTLAASLHELGQIQCEQGEFECVTAYEGAISLYKRIGARQEEAVLVFNLGQAYEFLALGDLAQAERWYRRSLELHDEYDQLGRGKCLTALGGVAYKRFLEARAADELEEEPLCHLNGAIRFYHQALNLFPPNAVDDLAVVHNNLGETYRNANDLDRALMHYREAIRYREGTGNHYEAGGTRHNVALALAEAGRLVDARDYAYAALRNYQSYEGRAAEEERRTERLITWIEGLMRGA